MSSQAFISNATATTLAAVGDGYSVPRMPTAQRLAIVFTARDQGMMVYDTTLNNLFIWTGAAWESVPASGDAGANGSVQYNDNGVVSGAANLQYDKAGGFTSLRSGSALRAYVADNSVYSTIKDNGNTGGLTIDNLNADGISLRIGGVNTNVLGAGTANWYDGAGVSQMAFDGSTKKLSVTNVDIWRGLLNDGTSTAVGTTALAATIAGATDNTAVGYRAMYRASTANANTSVGFSTLSGLAFSGGGNVAVGYASGSALGTGSQNVCIGTNAMNGTAGATGSFNIAVGNGSMLSGVAISGADNVGVGRDTFRNLTSGNNNVAVGRNALNVLTNGISNTAVGESAGSNVIGAAYNFFGGTNAGVGVTTGNSNVSIGVNSMNTSGGGVFHTGSSNIAIGSSAMYSGNIISGADNIGIGQNTLRTLSNGVGNICIGLSAGNKLASANYTVAVGYQALSNYTGSDSVAVGTNALVTNTSGVNNVAVGRSALSAITSASNNTALGYFAAQNTTASGVTAVGAAALNLSTGGDYNTAIGHVALGSAVVTGGYNTALGWAAGYAITGGIGNTFLGTNSGASTTTGSGNICIGRDSATAAGDSNVIAIGSAGYFVGTNGGANTYYANAVGGTVLPPAGATGFWRVSINGTFRKIAVYAD